MKLYLHLIISLVLTIIRGMRCGGLARALFFTGLLLPFFLAACGQAQPAVTPELALGATPTTDAATPTAVAATPTVVVATPTALVATPTAVAVTATPTAIREEAPATVEAEGEPEEADRDAQTEDKWVLTAILPEEPLVASVFRVAAPDIPSLTEVRQLASQFGLPDDIYVEEPLTYYYSFGVTQTLTVSYDPDGTSIAYRALSDEADVLPFDQAVPMATTFLTERGLFDFPHRLIPGYGGEVLFLRLLDGRPVTSPPELTVSADTAGRVFALSYEPLPSFTLLGEYPLLSAQEAWQRVQAGTSGDFSAYNLYPTAPRAVEVPPDDSLPPWWGRTYRVGQQAKLWGYVTVFRPAEGDGPPRIRFGSAYPGEFWLEAPETELRAMATHREQIIRGWGMVTAISPLGGTLELAGWEIVPPAPEVVTLTGPIQRADGQTLLISDTGQTLLLPDAPAELPDGYRVRVTGLALAIEPTDGPYPVFEWDAIERYGEGLTSVAPVEPPIRQVVISEVELIYDYQSAAYTGTTDSDGLPLSLLLPAWRFSGTTNVGDTIEFIVPAVTDELVP